MKKAQIIIIIIVIGIGFLLAFKKTDKKVNYQNEQNKTHQNDDTSYTKNNTPNTGVVQSNSNSDSPTINTGIVAGLDNTVEISENGKSITKQFNLLTSYKFSNNDYFQYQSVNKADGYIEIMFKTLGVGNSSPSTAYVSSSDSVFTVNRYQLVRVNLGQTVVLNGTTIKVRLISIDGTPCPTGTQC